MGEIGIPREDFLYTLRLWEIAAIRRGYHRRQNREWERARFMSFILCKTSMGGAPKVKTPQDLFRLPHETDEDDGEPVEIDDEEVERLRRLIREENEKNARKKKQDRKHAE